MSFEIVQPGAMVCGDPLDEGQVSIGRRGVALFRRADLELVGLRNYAVVLADAGTLRIAVRAPRDGEQQLSVAVWDPTPGGKPDCGRRRISLARALRRLNVTPDAVAGRYELTCKGTGADAMLIINLLGADTERQGDADSAK